MNSVYLQREGVRPTASRSGTPAAAIDLKVPMVASPQRLDPFGIYPDYASCISGLGGASTPADSHYAFFGPYTPASGGKACFSLRFTNLRAIAGTLDLIVRVLPRGSSVHAREVIRRRLILRELPTDLSVDIEFTTFPGAGYALAGEVSDGTIVEADDLELLWRPNNDAASPDFLPPPDPTSPVATLLTWVPPSLAQPVSQMCTAAQFEEAMFAHWASRMGESVSRHRKQWEFVFILQSLAHYGALRSGARALGFGVGREPLPAVFGSMGIDVLATDLPAGHDDRLVWDDTNQHGATAEDLRYPALCADMMFAQHVRYRPVDMSAIPEDLIGFDFTWSSCAFEHLGSIEKGLAFVERSIECLRPGGIAVHTTELNLTSDDLTMDHAATVLFRRRDMTKLALILIAQGHRVAPLCFHSGDAAVDRHVDLPPYCGDVHLKIAFGSFATTSFGIIVQKGGDG